MMKKQKITNQIIRRIIIAYLVVLVISISAFFIMVMPRMILNEIDKAADVISLIRSHYIAINNSMTGAAYSIIVNNELFSLLEESQKSGSKSVKALISLQLSQMQETDEKLLAIVVEDSEGLLYESIPSESTEFTRFLLQTDGYTRLRDIVSDYYSPVYENVSLFSVAAKEGYYPFCFYSKAYTHYGDKYLITVCYNLSSFISNMDSMLGGELDEYAIYNRSGELAYATGENVRHMMIDGHEEIVASSGIIKGKEGTYIYNRVLSSNHIIIGFSSNGTLLKSCSTLLIVVILLLVITPIIFSISVLPLIDRSLAPLKKLSQEMTAFRIGARAGDIIHTGDEIEQLSESFNAMINQINNQADDIVAHEREQAKTDFKLWTTQIDPHFVANAMNIINVLARNRKTEDILVVNNALISLLRTRLNVATDIFSTVNVEIELLRQYMLLVNFRYKNKINVSYEINEDVTDIRILKNILQPLVENAINHGLADVEGTISGNISIMIYTMDSQLIIEISDDGKGIDQNTLSRLLEHHFNINKAVNDRIHIGLDNIFQRLKRIYHDDFTMDISSNIGFGTTVIISFPIRGDIYTS
jgi:sensor histidine kinase YesM